ncbi:cyclic nucleotide-binding domain-containing protein [Derxia lacustris]|uniref:cyclic nucleotide-binding domain-containing protein n=1 Tax=Derxia lacustris TaxID=764842 RepID=UPI000A1782E1|nr:cyclic nucleotide-binding domain-containing protein [Derxia lacustris]
MTSLTSYQDRLRHIGCRYEGSAAPYAPQIHALVSRSPMLEDRTVDEVRRLALYMDLWSAPAGTCVITEGEPGDFMLLVIGGSVEVVKRDRWGMAKRIAIVRPGETLGEMSMLDGEPRFASCQLLEDATFAVLHGQHFERLINDDAPLASRILLKLNRMLSQRLRQTGAKLVAYMETMRTN